MQKNEWIKCTATNADLIQDPTMENSVMGLLTTTGTVQNK